MKILSFGQFFNEEEASAKTTENLEAFSDNRLKGASTIATNAEEKGGDAMLTYHHFYVKLPYYEKAKNGNMNLDEAKQEYKDLLEKLYLATKDDMDIEQIAFQELVGKIEVIGELLIKTQG